ncbi:MAG: hypothetical protein RQ741_00905 [Wenzhouxiangellaceae bacterium]|nr:hypothetical protein [Wenzhouxiangellaceae bacterium]
MFGFILAGVPVPRRSLHFGSRFDGAFVVRRSGRRGGTVFGD